MKRIKLTDDVHSRLVEYQQRNPLPFSELVGLALTALESSKQVYVGPTRVERVAVNVKRAEIPDDMLDMLLQSRCDIFVPEIHDRQAAYLRRHLEKKSGLSVNALPSSFGRESGWLFVFNNTRSHV